MARQPRAEEPGAIHHVYARGVRGVAIFADDDDRERYLRLLGRTARWFRWNCLQFCMMTNHVHLLIETPRPNLGAGMSRLHGEYARTFNERHGTVGHLFQSRYGATRIKDDTQLITVVRYLDENPVGAGLVSAPDQWRWCSAAAIRGHDGPPWLRCDRLFELLPEGRIELEART
jgi:putative transposase